MNDMWYTCYTPKVDQNTPVEIKDNDPWPYVKPCPISYTDSLFVDPCAPFRDDTTQKADYTPKRRCVPVQNYAPCPGYTPPIQPFNGELRILVRNSANFDASFLQMILQIGVLSVLTTRMNTVGPRHLLQIPVESFGVRFNVLRVRISVSPDFQRRTDTHSNRIRGSVLVDRLTIGRPTIKTTSSGVRKWFKFWRMRCVNRSVFRRVCHFIGMTLWNRMGRGRKLFHPHRIRGIVVFNRVQLLIRIRCIGRLLWIFGKSKYFKNPVW